MLNRFRYNNPKPRQCRSDVVANYFIALISVANKPSIATKHEHAYFTTHYRPPLNTDSSTHTKISKVNEATEIL